MSILYPFTSYRVTSKGNSDSSFSVVREEFLLHWSFIIEVSFFLLVNSLYNILVVETCHILKRIFSVGLHKISFFNMCIIRSLTLCQLSQHVYHAIPLIEEWLPKFWRGDFPSRQPSWLLTPSLLRARHSHSIEYIFKMVLLLLMEVVAMLMKVSKAFVFHGSSTTSYDSHPFLKTMGEMSG